MTIYSYTVKVNVNQTLSNSLSDHIDYVLYYSMLVWEDKRTSSRSTNDPFRWTSEYKDHQAIPSKDFDKLNVIKEELERIESTLFLPTREGNWSKFTLNNGKTIQSLYIYIIILL